MATAGFIRDVAADIPERLQLVRPHDRAPALVKPLGEMLTIVALLLLPFVFGMSLYRAYQLPQVLLSRKRWLNPKHPLAAAVAVGTTYIALVVYTVLVLYTATRMVMDTPKSVQELFSIAAICVGYPLVYLAFEWVLFYSVKSGLGR